MTDREPIAIDEVTCPNCGAAARLRQYETTDNPHGECPNCKSVLVMPGAWGRWGKLVALAPNDQWVPLDRETGA